MLLENFKITNKYAKITSKPYQRFFFQPSKGVYDVIREEIPQQRIYTCFFRSIAAISIARLRFG